MSDLVMTHLKRLTLPAAAGSATPAVGTGVQLGVVGTTVAGRGSRRCNHRLDNLKAEQKRSKFLVILVHHQNPFYYK
jgi:hypothetical protein